MINLPDFFQNEELNLLKEKMGIDKNYTADDLNDSETNLEVDKDLNNN